MSTLWTPGGEVPVGGRGPEPGPTDSPDASAPSGPGPTAAPDEGFDFESLSPEEREAAEEYVREMAEARERLRQTPAAMVVVNHAMGLYELAAIHLASQPPNLAEATVAIDSLGALLDGMQGRLGEPEPTLRDGLSQIRMAFVALKNRSEDAAESSDAEPTNDPG